MCERNEPAGYPVAGESVDIAIQEPPRDLSIDRLLDRTPLDSRAVDEFLRDRTTPLVEGTSVTLLYRGEADAVRLRHFTHGLPLERSFHRVDGTDLWYLVIDVPEQSRIEYKLEVVASGEGRWIEDPLNPLRARDPFGANSVLRASGYEVPDWCRPDPEAPGGRLEDVDVRSRTLRRNSRVTMYLPAGFQRTRRHPLLVVHDGGDYLEFSGLKTVLDNLVHRREIDEIVVAFVHPRRRMEEYTANPAHSRFLTEELVPRLESRYRPGSRPGDRGLMGASMGAVSSLHAAWSHPGSYGRLLIQSGSFASSDFRPPPGEPLIERIVAFVDSYRDHPIRLAERVYVSCGLYEPLVAANRALVPILRSAGMDVRYTEARDGHNWENWRDRLREGLSWLFPVPAAENP